MQIQRPAPLRSRLNLTPLVDVVFILLVFFMLAFKFTDWRAITLDVPAESDGAAGAALTGAARDPVLLVRVHEGRNLDVNGRRVTLPELLVRLRERREDGVEMPVLLQPKADIPLQEVVFLMDELARAGASRVSILR